jgi:diguanylate cyclase (GGDEF)-like protein/PAS domain S-box-containing protein
MAPDLVDLRTVFLMTTLVSVTTALMVVFLWRSHPEELSLPAWTLGSLLVATGYLGIAMRGWLPLFVSVSIANGCIAAGHACFLNGFLRLTGRRFIPWWIVVALGIAITVIFTYFTFAEENLATRMSIQFAVLGLLALASAYRLVKTHSGVMRLTHRTVAGVFAIFGMALLLRVAWMPFDPPGQNLFAHNPVHDTVFVIMLLFYAALMYCFPALLYAKDIDRRTQVERALRESDDAYRAILSSSLDGFLLIGPQGRVLDVNESYLRQSGYSRTELLAMRIPDLEAMEAEADTARHIQRIVTQGSDLFVSAHRRKDGSIWHVEISVIHLPTEDGGRFFSFLRDITQRTQAESDLRIAAAAFESQEGMVVTDADKIILRANQGFTDITGYPTEEVIGRKMSFLRSGHHDNAFYVAMWNSIAKEGSWQGEIWNRNKNGEIHPHWLTISTVKDSAGKVTHYIGAYTDITERKEEENRIRSLAFYDPLTHLPNRRLMLDRLEQALAGSIRHHRRGALMLLDLDHFKAVNDTLGHETGDQLLVQVAQRLNDTVRQSDLVARLGGDEFIVVLTDIESPSDVAHIASKLVTRISEPFLIGTQEVSSSPSIGICLYPDDATDSRALLKLADVAMYDAKARGRGNFQFFTEEMQIVSANRLAIEADLGSALIEGQFTLFYQPQLDLHQQRPVGIEALVRWQHPRRGLLEPSEFLAIAEEIGTIVPLGEWILAEACRQLAAWHADGHTELKLAVNLSASEFRNPDLVRIVREVLERTGIPPGKLELEVSEMTVMQDPAEALPAMQSLTRLGVSLSIDDFGTASSSLPYLGLFPIGALKIDGKICGGVGATASDAQVCDLAVTIAHRLGLDAVAEGVETAAQLQHLRDIGCDRAQGNLICKPLPAEEAGRFLRDASQPQE